ncbi:MAG TPA: hypothetical protein VN888_20895 [Mycobacterium sp.]|nr:hypothetical protein [Mycobacterium sp.]
MPTFLSGLSSGAVVVVGIVVVILGAIVLIFGVGGGIAKMVKELRETAGEASGGEPIEQLEKLVTAVTALLRTLIVTPIWLTLVLTGFALVFLGAWLIGGA